MSTYIIDGNDLKEDLGFDVKLVSGLESIPGRKGETFQAWGDSHGIEPFVDAEDIILKERIIEIEMLLITADMVEARNKIYALETILFTEGNRSLEIDYVGTEINCYVRKAVEVTRSTKAVADMIVHSVKLELVETIVL